MGQHLYVLFFKKKLVIAIILPLNRKFPQYVFHTLSIHTNFHRLLPKALLHGCRGHVIEFNLLTELILINKVQIQQRLGRAKD